MVLLYMVTFTINIPQMLAYIPAPWILWVIRWYRDIFMALWRWIKWIKIDPLSFRGDFQGVAPSEILASF